MVHIIAIGSALTWDVPIQSNVLMSQPFIEQLTAVGEALGQRPSGN